MIPREHLKILRQWSPASAALTTQSPTSRLPSTPAPVVDYDGGRRAALGRMPPTPGQQHQQQAHERRRWARRRLPESCLSSASSFSPVSAEVGRAAAAKLRAPVVAAAETEGVTCTLAMVAGGGGGEGKMLEAQRELGLASIESVGIAASLCEHRAQGSAIAPGPVQPAGGAAGGSGREGAVANHTRTFRPPSSQKGAGHHQNMAIFAGENPLRNGEVCGATGAAAAAGAR